MTEYAVPLRLVSPMMGTHSAALREKVRDAQWLLAGHNRFDGLAPYKDGELDGIYGRVTAVATARAKWWLGYPAAACDQSFGQTLYEYLRPNKWRPLPDAYRERRKSRLAAVAQTVGEKALAQAVTQIGVKEYPFGSNRTQFGVEYGWNGVAWCAIFVSCMTHRSGYVTSTGRWRFRYSYVPDIWSDAVAGRNGLRRIWTPRPGDLACFDFRGETNAHVAFVRQAPSGGSFVDLGGNTGPVELSNGGEVMSQTRSLATVHGFVRIDG